MKKVVIIGAGPAGITAGVELVKQSKDYEVTILEASSQVGGIAKTVLTNSGRMDLGGHRFVTNNEEVKNWWEEILQLQGQPALDDRVLKRYSKTTPGGPDPEFEDEVMLSRKRVASIYYNNKLFEYPVKFNSGIIKNMGIGQTAKAGFSYLESSIFKKKESNLEYFFINRFGKQLYQSFFEGYTEKLWGRHPSQISADWGAERLKGISVGSILKDKNKKNRQDASHANAEDAEEFLYPKYGPGQFWELAANRFCEYGGKLRLNCHVNGIETENNVIKGVRCTLEGQEFVEDADIVISSMPMKELLAGLKSVPFSVEEVGKGLPYRDLVVIGILVPSLKLQNTSKIKTFNNQIPDCWIYVQDTSVKLGRIQIYNNWSPYLTSSPQESVWIGLEYFCNEGDYYWNQSDVQWQNLAISELSKIGILESNPTILDFHKEMVLKAYPAYFDTYPRFDEIRRYLDSYPNLYCIGRNGQHRYFNMDQAMLTSFEAVHAILSGKTEKTKVWNVNDVGGYHPAPASNQLITPAPGAEPSRPKIYVEGAADNRSVNATLAAASQAAREGATEDGKKNPLMSIKDRLSMRSFRKPKQTSSAVNYALLSDSKEDPRERNSYRTAAIPVRSNYQDPGERITTSQAPVRRKPSGIKKDSETADTYVVNAAPVKKEHVFAEAAATTAAATAVTAAVAASAHTEPAPEAEVKETVREEAYVAPVTEEVITEPAPAVEEISVAEAYAEPATVIEEVSPVEETIVEETYTEPVTEEVFAEPEPVFEEVFVEEAYAEPAPVMEEAVPAEEVVAETYAQPVVEEVYAEPEVVAEAPVIEEVYTEPEPVFEEALVEEAYAEPEPVAEAPVIEEIYTEPEAVFEEAPVEETYTESAPVIEEVAPVEEAVAEESEENYSGLIGSAKFNPNEAGEVQGETAEASTVFTPRYFHDEPQFDPAEGEYDYYADYGSRREEYDSAYGYETYDETYTEPVYEDSYPAEENNSVEETPAESKASTVEEDGSVKKSNDFGNLFAMPTEEETRRKSTGFVQPYIPLDKPEISLVPKKEEKKEFLNQTGAAYAMEKIDKVLKTEISLKPKKPVEEPVAEPIVVSVPRPSYRVAKGVFTPKPITPEEKAKLEEEERAKRPIAPSINFKKAPEEPKEEEEKKPQHKVRKKNFVKPTTVITADWETMNAKTLRELPEMDVKEETEEKAEIKVQKSDLPNYDIFGEMSFDGKKEKKKESKKDPAAAAIAASIEAARLKEEQQKEEFRARVKAAEEATRKQIEEEAAAKGTGETEETVTEVPASSAPAVTIEQPAKDSSAPAASAEREKKENYVHHLSPSEIEVPKDLFANARVIAVIKNGVKTSTTSSATDGGKTAGETTVKKTIQKYTSDFETTTVKSIRKLRAKRQEEAIRSITSMLEGNSERKVVQPRPKSPAVDLTKPAETVEQKPVVEAVAPVSAVVPETKVETPVVTEPKFEEPVTEQVAAEPVYETPVAEPVYEAPVYEEPVKEEAPNVYEESVVENIYEQPVAEEPAIEESDSGFKLDLRLKDGSHRVVKDFPLTQNEEPAQETSYETVQETETVVATEVPVETPVVTEETTTIVEETIVSEEPISEVTPVETTTVVEETTAIAEDTISAETPVAEEIFEDAPVEKPKRTYRKRTPKVETEATAEAPMEEIITEQSAEAPKKRGRKPKAETAVVIETEANGDEIVAVKKPRKPRAKKTEDGQITLDLTTEVTPVSEMVSAEEAVVDKPKRTYRKRTPKVEEATTEDTVVQDNSTQEITSEPKKSVRKPRAKKTETVAETVTENSSGE
ncbi:MAG: FAD-dependent oxidoreductase [Lachnospiraceae bacterium]|nr:FAD-dependent oxidoreductase [Lachnospiraceae bacterium]